MRKLFLFSILALLLASCKSNEEKAAELIKNELYKTLYDFDSYQPIETKVSEAKLSIYNDSTFRSKGALFAYSLKKIKEYIEEAEDAKDRMDIWGRPTYYSSTYSDNKYYEYKEKWESALSKAKEYKSILDTLAKEIRDTSASLDTNQIIGWEVLHKFRCKTKGGTPTIGDYRYVIDKKFKRIIMREDLDDEDDESIRTGIQLAMTWDSEEE